MKKRSARHLALFPVFLAVSFAAWAAQGATITVNSTADAGGTCPGADCTLRQAIATAVSGDTINFSLPTNSAITLTGGRLMLTQNVTISGPGAKLLSVRRTANAGRIFDISSNSTISGLTISNGSDINGGGITIAPGGTLSLNDSTISDNSGIGAANAGGGIYNTGMLTITNSTISGNSSTSGGGIYNTGVLAITNSSISGNPAGSGGGGGIFSNGGTVTINNSTISGNSAVSPGGGIRNANGTLTITSSTISDNSVSSGGGVGAGISHQSGTVNARNTIIAQNIASGTGPDFAGTLTSQGYNLIGNSAGATITGNTTGNQLNVNPILGPLQNNGGPTSTHALLSGSPAIEGGHSSGFNTDQRGLARPVDSPAISNVGDGSDIGAYEVQADQLPGCSNINRVVNNNADSGTDSLRAVIDDVCAGSTITFAPGVTGVIDLTSGELLIAKSLSINGPGANLLSIQRSAGNFRIFNVAPASVIATISGLTIANGNFAGSGGGIFNTGTLTVTQNTISGNVANSGGGIFNNGTMAISSSTISGNSATAGISGGGIVNLGTVTITNSTIFGNSAAGSFSGGGILNQGGTVTITNSTLSGNSALANFSGGGINNGGTVRARNTIIALNTSPTGPDVNGALTSDNFNLIGNNSGATIAPAQFGDQIGSAGSPINPMLGPLQDNGGPTFTRALLAASTAIDKGNGSGATTDQRGFPRPIGMATVSGGDGSDIGAFEFGSAATPVQVLSAVSRKAHGGAGTFDINLPLKGNRGVECRSGGATSDYQVVFTFASNVTFNSAAVTAGAGSISSSSGSGSTTITVGLTGVTNAQTVTINLTGVSNGSSTTDVDVQMGMLLGDTNGNRTVNATDVGQTKAASGLPITAANFRSDANANGSINATDIGLVKSRSGTSLPPN